VVPDRDITSASSRAATTNTSGESGHLSIMAPADPAFFSYRLDARPPEPEGADTTGP
jgi:hypothetical protein